jgi:hypothetical protein
MFVVKKNKETLETETEKRATVRQPDDFFASIPAGTMAEYSCQVCCLLCSLPCCTLLFLTLEIFSASLLIDFQEGIIFNDAGGNPEGKSPFTFIPAT